MEKWVDILGYEGLYQVSDYGNVKSLDGVFRNQYTSWPKRGATLSPRLHTGGYLRVFLYKDGLKTDHYIHRLVADAFIQQDETRKQINHKNGIKKDNRVVNLERCTSKENIEHAFLLGLTPKNYNIGESNGVSKLDITQVKTIRECHKLGLKPKYLAQYFRLHQSSIYPIINNKSWVGV